MYGVNEIMKITGYTKNKSYQIIRQLQEQMKKDYKDVIIIGSRIPISIFNKYVLLENTERQE